MEKPPSSPCPALSSSKDVAEHQDGLCKANCHSKEGHGNVIFATATPMSNTTTICMVARHSHSCSLGLQLAWCRIPNVHSSTFCSLTYVRPYQLQRPKSHIGDHTHHCSNVSSKTPHLYHRKGSLDLGI